MAYTKTTNFATKDALSSGDPLKIVKGAELNVEFDNIATASALNALKGANSDITSMTALTAPTVAANPVRATDLQSQLVTAFTTGGTGTAFTLTPTPAITAYTAGQEWDVSFSATCGAAPTLQVSGLASPPNLVKQNADGTYSGLSANDFPSGWQSKVKMVSATQALVRSLPTAGSSAGISTYSVNTTLTAADSGKWIFPTSGSLTFTLPLLSSSPLGTAISVSGNGLGVTIARQGSDTIAMPASTVSSIPIAVSDTAIFVKVNTTSWYVLGGELHAAQSTSLSFGITQSWQAVTRTSGTTYYNTTGKPIIVKVEMSAPGAGTIICTVSTNGVNAGIIAQDIAPSGGNPIAAGSIIIPAGASYVLTDSGTATGISRATYELR